MIIIKHRINSIYLLQKTPHKFGVEIDLRSYKNEIIINHEPFKNSESFQSWLKNYHHKLLILNIKEERIEIEVLKIIKQFKIKNYFFLDSTIPMISILNKKSIFDIALRISNYESHNNYINLIKKNIKNKWIWIDTIDGEMPINLKDIKKLKISGYKTCLVSPELPLKSLANLDKFQKKYIKFFDFIDAVCTKKNKYWEKYEY
tara:strand:+ start:24 stop:632 length:609 start_codon:yes stop_codon:yes gene_type:complete